ncbi:MAG: hypothetical protein J5939_01975 [Bacteroidales bacterium]|nr:hypothetical protein [Bacteroidales bacterium]
MKRVILSLLCGLLSSLLCTAQVYVGGNLSIDRSSTWDQWKGTLSVNPEIGSRISDRWMAGVRLNSQWLDNTTTARSLSVMPYARYEVFGKGNWGLWMHGGVTASRSSSRSEQGEESLTHGLQVRVLPVVTYRLSDHFLLTADLSFASLYYTRYRLNDLPVSQSYGLGLRSIDAERLGDISVGFLYCF